MPDSTAIDSAVVTRLNADVALRALLTDGVHFDLAPANATAFGIVSLATSRIESVFGGRGYEDQLYLVKAVVRQVGGTSGMLQKALQAAARIDTVLEDQPITVSGYTWMTTFRDDVTEESRVRYTEGDESDASVRWHHVGGHYRVQMSIG